MTKNKDLQQIKEDIQNIKDEATYRGYYGSLANKMIDIKDTADQISDLYENKPATDENYHKLLNHLYGISLDIEDELRYQDISSMYVPETTHSTKFDEKKQDIVDEIKVDVPYLDGRVAKVVDDGYIKTGGTYYTADRIYQVIRKQKIEVYRYDPKLAIKPAEKAQIEDILAKKDLSDQDKIKQIGKIVTNKPKAKPKITINDQFKVAAKPLFEMTIKPTQDKNFAIINKYDNHYLRCNVGYDGKIPCDFKVADKDLKHAIERPIDIFRDAKDNIKDWCIASAIQHEIKRYLKYVDKANDAKIKAELAKFAKFPKEQYELYNTIMSGRYPEKDAIFNNDDPYYTAQDLHEKAGLGLVESYAYLLYLDTDSDKAHRELKNKMKEVNNGKNSNRYC